VRNIRAAVVREKGSLFSSSRLCSTIRGRTKFSYGSPVRDQHFPPPRPAVLGHEGAGIVEKVGAKVNKVTEGDAAVLSFNSCGVCANCQSGRFGYCPDLYGRNFCGVRPDGSSPCCDIHGSRVSGYFFAQPSFGEYAIATERNVIKIPKDVPVEIMVPLGCGRDSDVAGTGSFLH
jgi:aryl-alcohol dehydrogenase